MAASVVILTAGYILWTIQRVYLGPEYKGPHADALRPMSRREVAIAAPLLALAILFGVYPGAVRLHESQRAKDRDRDGRLDGVGRCADGPFPRGPGPLSLWERVRVRAMGNRSAADALTPRPSQRERETRPRSRKSREL